MQSPETRVSAFGNVAGMPDGITVSAFLRLWAMDRISSRS
jgi:hypothetical protein